APVLAAIPNFTITEGQTLRFTNSATDVEAPPETLTFGLSNAPAGATIGATNGVFAWTPTPAQAPGTNVIFVTVTDNGAPPLSDAKAFAVAVVLRPVIQSITVSNNLVTITWSAGNGLKYAVQYKDQLDNPSWTDLPPDVTATG